MNLKELRAKHGLTQAALAKELGVTGKSISLIETGKLKLSRKLSAKIHEVYGETVEPAGKAVKKAAAAVAAPEKKPRKPRAAKAAAEKKTEKPAPTVVIQSPMGGEITTEEILAKLGDVDAVYVRVDQNKAYWVKGEETGDADLW